MGSSQSGKNLGLVIETDIFYKHSLFQRVDKTNKMCNIILNNIIDVDVCNQFNLYKCYVRPLLNYAICNHTACRSFAFLIYCMVLYIGNSCMSYLFRAIKNNEKVFSFRPIINL